MGNASQVDARREGVIADFVRLCGDRHDQRALELSLFAGLVELDWNKALDAVEHADPKTRAAQMLSSNGGPPRSAARSTLECFEGTA